MFGTFFLFIPYEKCNVSPCKPFTFGCDLGICLLLHEGTVYLPLRVAETGLFRKRENFHRHLLQRHNQTTIPERCAERLKDLTDRIVRMNTYPVAYGGFSDVWTCQLRCKRSPSKKVRLWYGIVLADITHYWVKGSCQGHSTSNCE